PDNLRETVIIQIENWIKTADAWQLPYLNDPIKVFLQDSGIGVWTVDDLKAFRTAHYGVGYPSRIDMLAANKRVIFITGRLAPESVGTYVGVPIGPYVTTTDLLPLEMDEHPGNDCPGQTLEDPSLSSSYIGLYGGI